MNTLPLLSRSVRRGLRPLAAGLALCLAASPSLRAELQWDTREINRSPEVTDATVEAVFGFVNHGKSPVTIKSVNSSCGCTVATLRKMDYAPGERGEVLATFKVGDRKGKQTVVISITPNDGARTDDLRLSVVIPEAAKIMPTLLSWDGRSTPGSKAIEVTAMPGRTVRVVKVTSKAALKTQIETLEEGARYQVVVEPETTDKSMFSVLDISVLVDGHEKQLQAYVRVGAGGVGMPANLLPGRTSASLGADGLNADPKALSWVQNGEDAAKSFVVRAPAGRPLKIRQVTVGNLQFDTSFQEIGANEFRVDVKPRSLSRMGSTLVTVEAQSGEGTSLVRVPAQVLAPPARPQ